MKQIALFCLVLMFLGCQNSSISEDDLHYINGYWEIEEVTFTDGSKKNYTINPSIDFIQLDDNQGFRKKMRPKFDGTYNTSNVEEFFKIIETNNTFILNYKNNLNEWEERLIQLDSTSFTVKNKEGVLYTYKRFQPIVIPK